MGKKKTSQASGAKAGGSKRSTKHLEALQALPRASQMQFFEVTPPEKLLQIFEESYPGDLVNILLDLKRASVKHLFETISKMRKRAVAEAATLFYYRDYLTNPLPLRVGTDAGLAIPNYYAILGVPRDSESEDLKQAHKLLTRAHDPEAFSLPLRKTAEERLAEINDAFNNLKTPEKRARADRLLPNVSYLYPRRDQSWLDAVNRLIE